jgi:hypothetical protein
MCREYWTEEELEILNIEPGYAGYIDKERRWCDEMHLSVDWRPFLYNVWKNKMVYKLVYNPDLYTCTQAQKTYRLAYDMYASKFDNNL